MVTSKLRLDRIASSTRNARLRAEVLIAVTHEGARSLQDIMLRRLRIGLELPDGGVVVSVPNVNNEKYPAVLLLITPDNKIEEFYKCPPHPETGKAFPFGVCVGPQGDLYLADLQYWLILIGVSVMIIDLTIVGLIQGNAWLNGEAV